MYKIFEKNDVVIDFLNSVLDRKPGRKITEVTFTNPCNNKNINFDSESKVCLTCKDEAGKSYVVEIQMAHGPREEYVNNAVYHANLALASQVKNEYQCGKLVPVIFIAISNFDLFDGEDYMNQHILMNTETKENELNLINFYFIEVQKFTKKLDELDSPMDQWAYFLKHAGSINEIPQQLKSNKAIDSAFETLAHAK